MARGSIQKRIGKNGAVSWTAIVDLPPVLDPETGKLKRKQKRITADPKRELELELAKLVTTSAQGVPDASRATIAEFLDHWLRAVGPSLGPATQRRYQDLVRVHLLPTIGPVRIANLNTGLLQQLFAIRADIGLSNATINYMNSVVHKALDDGIRASQRGRRHRAT